MRKGNKNGCKIGGRGGERDMKTEWRKCLNKPAR